MFRAGFKSQKGVCGIWIGWPLVLSGLFFVGTASSAQLGTISYGASIDHYNDLNVTVPFDLPVGAGGQSIGLSLDYNSFYRDFPIGQQDILVTDGSDTSTMERVGHWVLGGISYIRKCDKLENGQDGNALSSDLCLFNGFAEVPLIPVTHDAAGTNINSDLWDFYRVGEGGGQESLGALVVYRKDDTQDANDVWDYYELRDTEGQTVTRFDEQGSATNGASGSSNTYWPSKIEDRSGYGNDVTYTYYKDGTSVFGSSLAPRTIEYSKDGSGDSYILVELDWNSIETSGEQGTLTRGPFLDRVRVRTGKPGEREEKYYYSLNYRQLADGPHGSVWLDAIDKCDSTDVVCDTLDFQHNDATSLMATDASGNGQLQTIMQVQKEGASGLNGSKLVYNIDQALSSSSQPGPNTSYQVSMTVDDLPTVSRAVSSVADYRLSSVYPSRQLVTDRELKETVGSDTLAIAKTTIESSVNTLTFGLPAETTTYRGSANLGEWDKSLGKTSNVKLTYDAVGRVENQESSVYERNLANDADVLLWKETTQNFYYGNDYTPTGTNEPVDDCTDTSGSYMTTRILGQNFKNNKLCQTIVSVENSSADSSASEFLNKVVRLTYDTQAVQPTDPSTNMPQPHSRNALLTMDRWTCASDHRKSSCTTLGGSLPSGRLTNTQTYGENSGNNLYPSRVHTSTSSGKRGVNGTRADSLKVTNSYDLRGNLVLEARESVDSGVIEYSGWQITPDLFVGLTKAWSGPASATDATLVTDYGPYDVAFGIYESISTPTGGGNSIQTSFTYDELGRRETTTRNGIVTATHVSSEISSHCPAGLTEPLRNAAYQITESQTGKKDIVSCYNVRGQVLREVSRDEVYQNAFGSEAVLYVDYFYLSDSQLLQKKSAPYKVGGTTGGGYKAVPPNGETVYEYAGGRVKKITEKRTGVVSDLVAEYSYSGSSANNSSSPTLNYQVTTVERTDSAGYTLKEVISVGPQGTAQESLYQIDSTGTQTNIGNKATYHYYDPEDFIYRYQVRVDVDAKDGNDAPAMTDGVVDAYYLYDSFGNLVQEFGDQIGRRYYAYNDFGQRERTYISGKTQTRIAEDYDYLADGSGRLFSVVDMNIGTTEADMPIIRYRYDDCDNGWNKLCSVSRGNTLADESDIDPATETTKLSFDYNSKGQVCRQTQDVKMQDKEKYKAFDMFYAYDSLGRLQDMLYPDTFSDRAYGEAGCVSIRTIVDSEQDFLDRLFLNYTYDPAGNLEAVSEWTGDGEKVPVWKQTIKTVGLNSLNEFSSTVALGNDLLRHTVRMDAKGRATYNGLSKSYKAYTTLRSQSHTYDINGNIDTVQERFSGKAPNANLAMGYDSRDRLTDDGYGTTITYGIGGNIDFQELGSLRQNYVYETFAVDGTAPSATALRLDRVAEEGAGNVFDLAYDDRLYVSSNTLVAPSDVRPNISDIIYNSARQPTFFKTQIADEPASETFLEYGANGLVYLEENTMFIDDGYPKVDTQMMTYFMGDFFEDSTYEGNGEKIRIQRAYVFADGPNPVAAVKYSASSGTATSTEGSGGSARRRLEAEYWDDASSSDSDGLHDVFTRSSDNEMYLEFLGDTESHFIQWDVIVDEPGLYDISFLYNYDDSPGSDSRTLELWVNNNFVSDAELYHIGAPPSVDWLTWSMSNRGLGAVQLEEGVNTIALQSKNESAPGRLYLDYMELTLVDHKIDQLEFATAKQSSIDGDGPGFGPHVAIDGITACDYASVPDASRTSTWLTSPNFNHWWQGDLGVKTTISSIRVHVGADCGTWARQWLDNFTVLISDTDFSQIYTAFDSAEGMFEKAKEVSSVYKSQSVSLDTGETKFDWLAPDGGIEGRYVSLWTEKGTPIQVTEVEAFGYDYQGTGVLRELWSDIYGYRIHNLTSSAAFPTQVSSVYPLSTFQDEPNMGDNFGTRTRGYLTTPVSGDYELEIAANEQTQVFVGEGSQWNTGSSETNKFNIATVDGTDTTGPTVVTLAGRSPNQKYYIEVLDKEAIFDDEFVIRWKKPGDAVFSTIPEEYLEIYAGPVCGALTDCLLAGSAPLGYGASDVLQSENRQYIVGIDPFNNYRVTLQNANTGENLWDSGSATDSNTAENPKLYFVGDGVSAEGDLYIYHSGTQAAWSADTAWPPERLQLTNDGVLQLLDSRGDVIWQVDGNSPDGCRSDCRVADSRDPAIEFADDLGFEAPLADAKNAFIRLISSMTDTSCSDNSCGKVTEIDTIDLESEDFVSPYGWARAGEVLRLSTENADLDYLFKINMRSPFSPIPNTPNAICTDNSGACELTIKAVCRSPTSSTTWSGPRYCETCPTGSTCGSATSDYSEYFVDGVDDVINPELESIAGHYLVLFQATDGESNDTYRALGIEVSPLALLSSVDKSMPITDLTLDLTLIDSYGSDLPAEGAVARAFDGNGLHVSGNRRVSHPLANSYTITENTVLQFESLIANPGDAIAVGLDNDAVEDPALTFKLAGDGTFGLESAVPSYENGKVQKYAVDVGDYLAAGTTVDRLFMMASDSDKAGGLADAVFRNVKIYERKNSKVGPVIYPNGPTPLEVSQGSDYVDPATCVDDIDANCDVIVTGESVNTAAVLGTSFTLEYDAVDSMGNQAEQIVQTVVIVDPATLDPFPTLTDSELWWGTDPATKPVVNQHVLENHQHTVLAGEGICSSVYVPTDSGPVTGIEVRLRVDDGTNESWVAAHWGEATPSVPGSKYLGSVPYADGGWHKLAVDLASGLQDTSGQPVAIGAGDVISGSAWTMHRGAEMTEIWWDDCIANQDDLGPVITFPNGNPHGLLVNETFNDPGYECTDSKDGACTVSSIDISQLDTSTEGTYPVYYTATDSDFNTTVTTLTVIVDSTAPVITVLGGNAEVWVQGAYEEPEPAFSCDDGGVDCTSDVSVDLSSVDTNALGTHRVTYSYTDAAGNRALEIRDVTVKFARRVEAEDADASGGTDLVQYAPMTSTAISPYITNKVQGYRNWSGMTDVLAWTVNVDAASTYDIRFALGCGPTVNGGCFDRDLDLFVNGAFAGLIDMQTGTGGWENFIVQPEFHVNNVDLVAGSNTIELRVASGASYDGPNVDYMEIIYDDSSEWTNTHAPEVELLLGNPGDPADGSMQLELNDAFVDPGYTCIDDVDGDCHHTVSGSTTYVDGVTGNSGTAGTYTVTINAQDTAPTPNVMPQVTRSVEIVAGIPFGNGAHRDIYNGIGSGNGVWQLTGHSKYINGTPSTSGNIGQLESSHAVTEGGCGDTCGQEIMAYLQVPVTGEYTFYVSGSRGTDLHMNLNGDPNGPLIEIAEIPGTNFVGYVSPLDKTSAEWTTFPEQVSTYFDHDGDGVTGETISLTAGDVVYVRLQHKTGWGGWKHVRAAWEVDATDPTEDIAFEIIPGIHLAPFDRLNQ
ncbi:hypothetical protein SAMN04488073_3235 [Marinobacter gudaonensis]|uniref:RHS repeat-associated core domain-containing protein n=1 Tax=Marinobacter gudaonensis TaxID=375760 RepID=A0A1I6HZH5_9GAMM|nr:immunoglobulin-like domain-containing protein [Marinobacter gudaonensis]SFR59872.1 hypothetical protein SAMN04488073_3235 [Marinobacter gudaonensis]